MRSHQFSAPPCRGSALHRCAPNSKDRFLRDAAGGEDFWLATDAYVYGYPLVTMEMTRRVVTNVPAAAGTRGPMGHIINLRQYPDATFRDVTAPNADTL